MNDPNGIDYFNRGHLVSKLQASVSLRARRRMFERWRREAGSLAGKNILDIGTTPDLERQDSNVFVRWCLDDGANVALYSPEPIENVADAFPGTTLVPAKGQSSDEFSVEVPVADKQYDWSMSSAVLEHVGDHTRQRKFISESARVASHIFLTTPNRWHWLEFHTKLPLLHWLPRPWHRKLLDLMGMAFWASEANLNLLSKSELLQLAHEALPESYSIHVYRVWALGMPSNLVLVALARQSREQDLA